MGLFPDTAPPGLISLKGTFPVKETVDKLIHLVESKGLTVFCRVDHAAGAAAVANDINTPRHTAAPHPVFDDLAIATPFTEFGGPVTLLYLLEVF